MFAYTDNWPEFLGHITDQISEATFGLGLFIVSFHSILADVVCRTHASLQCVVCLAHCHAHMKLVGSYTRSVVVSCSVFVYRHCLSPRERVGVYCDALPRYQPYTFPPLAYTSSLPPHVLSLIENVFACTDKWPQFLGHITDQISEATLGLGLFIISLHSILADVVCQTHASLQCVVCFAH